MPSHISTFLLYLCHFSASVATFANIHAQYAQFANMHTKYAHFACSDKLKWRLPPCFQKTQVRSLTFFSADTCTTPFLSLFATMTSCILSMCFGNSNIYYLFHYIACKSISTNKQMEYISIILLCFLIKIAFLAQRTGTGVGGVVIT